MKETSVLKKDYFGKEKRDIVSFFPTPRGKGGGDGGGSGGGGGGGCGGANQYPHLQKTSSSLYSSASPSLKQQQQQQQQLVGRHIEKKFLGFGILKWKGQVTRWCAKEGKFEVLWSDNSRTLETEHVVRSGMM